MELVADRIFLYQACWPEEDIHYGSRITFGQLHSDEGARGNPVPRTVLGLGFDHRAHGRFSHPANVLPEPDGRQQLTVNP